MNTGLMSAVAQVQASTFGATPPGFRPVTSAPSSAMPRYGPRVMRPTPGYGRRRSAGFFSGRASMSAGAGVVRNVGTGTAYPAAFAVRPNLMGLAETAFAPVDFDLSGGNPTGWTWSGPLLPLAGMVVGAILGATLVDANKKFRGGGIGAVVGWLATAGAAYSVQRGNTNVR